MSFATEWLAAAGSALAVIVPVELPDKTFVATLVLSTRYRPRAVWLGAAAAFGIQSAVAATAGGLIALLPQTPVRLAAAALFAIGAVLLLRGARSADVDEAEQERTYATTIDARAPAAREGWRAFGASFALIFLAEWGDLSQLFTAGLVAAGRPAVPVFFGAWLGLCLVAGLGAVLGRVILRYVRLRLVRYVASGVCAALAAVIVYSVVRT